MLSTLWASLLAKAASTALVVVVASILAEAFGPFWGALIISLPVSSGPAYVFLAMRHDDGFIAATALSSFAANAATGVYLATYAALAVRRPIWWSLGLALLVWFVAAILVQWVEWTPWTAMALNLAAYGLGYPAIRKIGTTAAPIGPAKSRRRAELLVRTLAIALFVTLVVVGSDALGPAATGVAAVFPISLTSLLIILQPRIGGSACALLAATAFMAMPGFGLMLLTLHLAVGPFGVTAAMLLALAASLAWSAGFLILRRR